MKKNRIYSFDLHTNRTFIGQPDMLENLIHLIQEHAGDAIINNPAIPNNQNEEAIKDAGHSIMDGLGNMISQGNLQGFLNLFQQGESQISENPAVQDISAGFIRQLTDKFGLNQSAANSVASDLIPNVLQQLVSRTNDPNDNSFNLQGILNQLTMARESTGLADQQQESGVTDGIIEKLSGLMKGIS